MYSLDQANLFFAMNGNPHQGFATQQLSLQVRLQRRLRGMHFLCLSRYLSAHVALLGHTVNLIHGSLFRMARMCLGCLCLGQNDLRLLFLHLMLLLLFLLLHLCLPLRLRLHLHLSLCLHLYLRLRLRLQVYLYHQFLLRLRLSLSLRASLQNSSRITTTCTASLSIILSPGRSATAVHP